MPRYAQHFLINSHAVQRIIDSLELKPHDSILEIGPGKGVLTMELVKQPIHVKAIEVDEKMVRTLQEKFGGAQNLQIRHEDFLEADLNSIPQPVKIVGNLPYNLTSPILRRLCEWPGWSMAIVMVQKEVGDRLCAAPGSKTYGALSVGVGLSCVVSPVFLLSETSFAPPPKVKSMVVRLDRRPTPLSDDILFTQRVIQAAFQQRRKTLMNALSHGLDLTKEEIQILLEELRIPLTARAENITLDQYVELSKLLKLKTVA